MRRMRASSCHRNCAGNGGMDAPTGTTTTSGSPWLWNLRVTLPSDSAPVVAERIAPYFQNITETSLITKVRRWRRSYRAGKLRVGGQN